MKKAAKLAVLAAALLLQSSSAFATWWRMTLVEDPKETANIVDIHEESSGGAWGPLFPGTSSPFYNVSATNESAVALFDQLPFNSGAFDAAGDRVDFRKTFYLIEPGQVGPLANAEISDILTIEIPADPNLPGKITFLSDNPALPFGLIPVGTAIDQIIVETSFIQLGGDATSIAGDPFLGIRVPELGKGFIGIVSDVPEPGSILLLGAGLVAIRLRRR